MHRQCASLCKGATIRYGGGGGVEFCLAIFIYFTREMELKLYFFTSGQDRLYFHNSLWPFIYFTHVSHKNIYFQKRNPTMYMYTTYKIYNV